MKRKTTAENEIVQFVVFLMIGVILLGIHSWPTNTFRYKGVAADGSGRVYLGEKIWIGVYENGEKVQRIIGDEGGRYYEFTIIDEQLHLWTTSNHRKILDLNGDEIGRIPESHSGAVFSEREKREFTADDGKLYKLDNGLLKRAKVTCYFPDGSQETVFQMPLGLYLTKLAFFVYLPSLAVWIIRQWHMNSNKQGSGKA